MTLIRSISGIRGTIGGKPGEALTPFDLVKYTAAFWQYIREKSGNPKPVIVVGRDARISGPIVNEMVCNTLLSLGVEVIDLGLSTTPTVEMNVTRFHADGGIILTASHNPQNWNALKLLNSNGEFLDAEEGNSVLLHAEMGEFLFAGIDQLGTRTYIHDGVDYHINKIIDLHFVNVNAIRNAGFSVVVDGINSSGGMVIPQLLKALGVDKVHTINAKPDGRFAHNPEPIPENLSDICQQVIKFQADLGIVVDPDVDRLALVCEDGTLFGEEYTLVACADYVLSVSPGNTVSNLSSTRALADVTETYQQSYSASAVGEVHVVHQMKKTKAIIGGEGNGGVILPALHYGRDALAGVALFLSLLAESRTKASLLKQKYPR
ncbi:MAG: phosphoglucosamine mutase, partial [Bacteroidales bacterium]|nr:phosphoglucosamine mutase [Bacteroidales bacterium]